ncbi:MAG: phospholipase D-like domain-containing protein [Candidatus Thorarchaeota archaeon]|jgi:phosphatidylserine/phosphatidylglycerophosphate/cardiolipin synthase-like enzyme
MRVRQKTRYLSVHLISGTYVVLIGINVEEEILDGLLGFAIRRIDHTEQEEYWLNGFKTFENVEPKPKPGELVSLRKHPLQSFRWGDYTAKPDHQYSYKIVALYGTPQRLAEGYSIVGTTTTEPVDRGRHAVFFNRGTCSSQAYARRFGDQKPSNLPNKDEAYRWLSRGLEEGILNFIRQANEPKYALRAAVYEFTHLPVLEAFKKAKDDCSDVVIIFHAKEGKETTAKNLAAIKSVELDQNGIVKKRTANKSYHAHNKFIILLENGEPKQVFTGSTNFTESGIFGQSNVGHIVRDSELAKAYFEYWKILDRDEEARHIKDDVMTLSPVPESLPPNSITPIFSPRRKLKALEWYAELMDKANETVCLTLPFGVHRLFDKVFEKDKDYLRYILFESKRHMTMLKWDKEAIAIAGAQIETGELDRWLKEISLGTWVHYVHTKYMLIDPLGDDPIVITGSANFSESSTEDNDENMMVIRGDTALADIYLGEFMRLFSHYYFRDVVSRQREPEATTRSPYLVESDEWSDEYFKEDTIKFKQRILFS